MAELLSWLALFLSLISIALNITVLARETRNEPGLNIRAAKERNGAPPTRPA